MIRFTKLYYNSLDKNIIIEGRIADNESYKYELHELYIHTDKTFTTEVGEDNAIFKESFSKGETRFYAIIDSKDFDGEFDKHIFFINVIVRDIVTGKIDTDASGFAVLYDKKRVYSFLMKNFKKGLDVCSVSNELISAYLHSKAFESALNLGEYQTAIKHWNIMELKNANLNIQPECR